MSVLVLIGLMGLSLALLAGHYWRRMRLFKRLTGVLWSHMGRAPRETFPHRLLRHIPGAGVCLRCSIPTCGREHPQLCEQCAQLPLKEPDLDL